MLFIGSVHDRLLTYIYIYTRSSNHPLIAGRTRKRATITGDLLRLRFTCCSIGAGESNKNRRSRFATRRGVASFQNQIVRFPCTDFRFYRNFNSEKGKKNRWNNTIFLQNVSSICLQLSVSWIRTTYLISLANKY